MKMARKKNLLICLDGASWNIIYPLIDNGELPNIKNLIDKGVSGKLESFDPLLSPSVWTSIVTGKKAEKHGILHFYNLQNNLKAKRIWNIFEDYGMKVGTAGFFLTWPPRIKNGFMIPDRYAFDSRTIPYRFKFFQELTLNRKIGGKTGNSVFYLTRKAFANGCSLNTLMEAGKVFFFNKILKPEHLDSFYREQTVYFRFLSDIFIKCINDYKPDLSLIYVPGTDVLAHRYWKYYKPDGFEQYINKIDRYKYKDIIPDFYKKVDKEIGRIIRYLPDNANIFIISDHGFKSRESSHLFQYKIKTDSVLKLLGLSEQLVYTNMGPFVIMHQKDNTQPPKGALLDCFKRFERVKINETGKNFFDVHWYGNYFGIRVIRILTESIENYHVSLNGKVLRIGDILRESTETSGVHSLYGILIASGENIKKGQKINGAAVFDITPTLLALNGFPVARDMDGSVLQELIEPEFLKDNPVNYIESYGAPDLYEEDNGIITEEDKIKEQLRAIGYID